MAEGDNLDQITRYLIARGLTPAQAAGVAGNLYVESKYNPSAFNQGEQAIGIAQWRLGRRQALNAYAASIGRSPTSLAAQLGFLWKELTENPSNGLAQLKAATTPAQAATVFDQYFERSDGNARQARISEANKIYKTIKDPNWIYGNPNDWTDTSGTSAWTGVPTSTGDSSGGTAHGWIDALPGGGLIAEGLDQTQTNLLAGIGGMLLKTVFIVGGLAIIGIGLAQAVKPAVKKTADTALTVVQTAKSATPAAAL